MVNILHRGDSKEEKLQKTALKEQRKSDIIINENRDINTETQAAGGIAFDFQAIDDEKIINLFDPTKDSYEPMLKPISPLFSRLNSLTQYDERGYQNYILSSKILFTQLKNCLDEEDLHLDEKYILLESLYTYLCNRAWDSYRGFKITTLVERTHRIAYEEHIQKPAGFFDRLAGGGGTQQ